MQYKLFITKNATTYVYNVQFWPSKFWCLHSLQFISIIDFFSLEYQISLVYSSNLFLQTCYWKIIAPLQYDQMSLMRLNFHDSYRTFDNFITRFRMNFRHLIYKIARLLFLVAIYGTKRSYNSLWPRTKCNYRYISNVKYKIYFIENMNYRAICYIIFPKKKQNKFVFSLEHHRLCIINHALIPRDLLRNK